VLWAKRMERRAAEDLRLSVLSNLALYLVAPVERWAPSVCAGLSFSFAYTFLVGLSWVFLRSSSCTAYIPRVVMLFFPIWCPVMSCTMAYTRAKSIWTYTVLRASRASNTFISKGMRIRKEEYDPSYLSHI
jgi:hypothetical protein